MRVQRARSSPSALREPLTRHPIGGLMVRLGAIAVAVVMTACASGTPAIAEKPWHQSPDRNPVESMLYFIVEWPAVRQLKPGMTESDCFKVLGIPVPFWGNNTILYSTSPQGVHYEVALKTSNGRIVDVSYKRRAA